jgi:membrane-associated phospholipid phosphatase
MIHAEPRPYWTDPRIIPKDCDGDFGYPSVHAFMSIYFYGYLALSLDNSNEEGRGTLWRLYRRNTKTVWTILAICFSLLIGFSRFYLGVHSYPQIIAGYFYGTFFLILHRFDLVFVMFTV